ncbi:putative transcription factor interactor and regulator CCHC(Zn) family [Helianthus annuus]|nr:putative transcription factor interactor and regulator CCHC(Zn) family [Helianthus annuus]
MGTAQETRAELPKSGGYLGNIPKCRKCQRHHSGSCAESCCHPCKKLGHMARDCRSPYPANRNQRQHQQGNERCYQCGAESHFKRNCPQMRQNRDNSGNQCNENNNGDNKDNRRTGNHELLNGQEEEGNNLNIVAGKFLPDNFFVSILVNSGTIMCS